MSNRVRTRRARILGVAGAVLLLAGVLAIVIAVRAQKSAPQPPASAASQVNIIPSGSSSAQGHTAAGRSSEPTTHGLILPRSVPLRLRIPAIGVDSTLRKIG